MINIIFSDNVEAFYDLWFLWDDFLKEYFNTYQSICTNARAKNSDIAMPYMKEFFNVDAYFRQMSGGVKHTIARAVNSLISAMNERERLPTYIVMLFNKDIIRDVDIMAQNAHHVLQDIVHWLLRQIQNLTRRKYLELQNKKPGAINAGGPTIIHVRMIRRPASIKTTEALERIFSLHAKFNDALNDTAVKMGHRILTLNSCFALDHFDHLGKLSHKGKEMLWFELDNLLEKFDKGKIKLLPNPKNPPHTDVGHHHQHNQQKLPTPPSQHSCRIKHRKY